MRTAIALSLAALTLSAPALAHDAAPEQRIAEKMNDPAMQDRLSGAMSGMLGAMLDLRIGEFERAIDPDAPVSRDETLRDRATRDDPWFEERMAYRTRAMTERMGAMAGGLAAMMPQLRAMGKRMARDLEGVVDRFPASGHDDDWDDWDD